MTNNSDSFQDTSSKKRTKNTKLNIVYSAFIKGFGILTSLVLVPLTLGYLNPVEYGIWLTLNSILLWVNTFDIGLGNGLRNRLAACLSEGDFIKGKEYISTAYFIISVVMIFIFGIFYFVNHFLDWHTILNVDESVVKNLKTIVLVSFSLFCLNFVFKLIGSVLLAIQKAAIENLLIMLSQILSLILIFILTKSTSGSLFNVALVYSISPVLVYLFSYPFVFRGKYSALRPSIKYVRKEHISVLMSLGGQFFVLQIAALIIFSTANLLITKMFGPSMVTTYNIAFRYFNLISLFFSIVLTPIWSATTEAFVKGDLKWIRNSKKKVDKLLLFTFLLLIIMTVFSNQIYKLWVGETIKVPLNLSISLAIYMFLLVASLSYSSFLNGIGKIRVQMINIIFSAAVFLPLTYILGKHFGIYGVVYSLILVNLSGFVLNYIQFDMLLDNKARGVWNK